MTAPEPRPLPASSPDPSATPPGGSGRGRRAAVVAVAVLVVLGIGIGIGLLVSDDSGDGRATPATSTTTRSSPAESTTTTAAPTTFRYQPLYPFRTVPEADAWVRQYTASSADAWHLDAGQTARRFTTDFLGFTEVDQIVATRTADDGAHVTVGYVSDEQQGRIGTAAVVHLARIGSGANAPWEVVGTDDTTLSLTTPAYGARASSPLAVGGRISGVDENLKISVRHVASAGALGTTCCIPAGGENTPWTASVTFSGATDATLTVVVSTGGHIKNVERFAVTGVRTG